MFGEQPHRLRAFAHGTERLVDDVQVIERVIVTDHLPQVRTETPDHAVAMALFLDETACEQAAEAAAAVKAVAPLVCQAGLQGAGPGVIADAIDLIGPFPTPGLRQALWISLVEQRHPGAGQRLVRGVHIYRQRVTTPAGFQPHQQHGKPMQHGLEDAPLG